MPSLEEGQSGEGGAACARIQGEGETDVREFFATEIDRQQKLLADELTHALDAARNGCLRVVQYHLDRAELILSHLAKLEGEYEKCKSD